MYEALIDAFVEAEADDEIRVILLSGEGACFTGGNDLKDFLNVPDVIGSDHVIAQFLRALSGVRKILMAAVHGPTVGIGVTMLLHCDLIVAAARSTRLITPFVQLGVVPEAASTLLLPQLLGYQRAAEMFFLGQPVDANTAREWGLVNRVVDDEVLMEEARALAASAARQPPGAVRATKRLMRAAQSAQVDAVIQEELREFAARLRMPEFAAAAQAFFGKPGGRSGGGT
jgi:enoyl-CoA hydratase/carnithine racemase